MFLDRFAIYGLYSVILHSSDREFQEKHYFDVLKYMGRKRAATVFDKICVKRGEPQLYGTQVEIKNGKKKLYRVFDYENLDKRRFGMCLSPIKIYSKEHGIKLN